MTSLLAGALSTLEEDRGKNVRTSAGASQ